MKRKKKTIAHFLLAVAAILVLAGIPLVWITVYAVCQPATYQDSYYAALPLKYDRLKNTSSDQGRVIVVGGSSVAFGIDSKIMEEELGMPCVNFGLYAAFGLKPMLDLSIGSLREGDIVILAPEFSSQMYSDYVGYEYLLEAMEGRADMAGVLGLSYARGFLGHLFPYIQAAKDLREAGGLTVSGVYAYSSFDEYGDIIYPREENTMDGQYSADNLPEIRADLVTEDFTDMINSYVKQARAKGAEVYFGYCPVNALSVADLSQESMEQMEEALESQLDCQVISSLEDHILDAGYFYDSNFHMNDAGVIANTVLLVNDIKRVTGNMTLTETSVPDPYTSEAGEVLAEGETEELTYEITAQGVTVTGLTADGLAATQIDIPDTIEGYSVIAIGSEAFAKAQAETIRIPSTVESLGGSLFTEAANLQTVYLNSIALPEVGNSLLEGASENLTLLVPKDLYGNYTTDYFWGSYGSHIAVMEQEN